MTRNEKILHGEKTGVLLFMNNVHIIMYNTPYLILSQWFDYYNYFLSISVDVFMFKILMLSKITIISTTFVNNTDNVHANDLA